MYVTEPSSNVKVQTPSDLFLGSHVEIDDCSIEGNVERRSCTEQLVTSSMIDSAQVHNQATKH